MNSLVSHYSISVPQIFCRSSHTSILLDDETSNFDSDEDEYLIGMNNKIIDVNNNNKNYNNNNNNYNNNNINNNNNNYNNNNNVFNHKPFNNVFGIDRKKLDTSNNHFVNNNKLKYTQCRKIKRKILLFGGEDTSFVQKNDILEFQLDLLFDKDREYIFNSKNDNNDSNDSNDNINNNNNINFNVLDTKNHSFRRSMERYSSSSRRNQLQTSQYSWQIIQPKLEREIKPIDNLFYIREQFQNQTIEFVPSGRKFHQMAHDLEYNKIWILAGESKFADERTATKYKYTTLSDLWSFDLKQKIWVKHICILKNIRSVISDTIPFKPIYGHSLVKIKRKLYCFGGCTEGGVMSYNGFTNRLCTLDLDHDIEYDDFRGVWVANWRMVHPYAFNQSPNAFIIHHDLKENFTQNENEVDQNTMNSQMIDIEGEDFHYNKENNQSILTEALIPNSSTIINASKIASNHLGKSNENLNNNPLPNSLQLIQKIFQTKNLSDISIESMRDPNQREAEIEEKPLGRYGHSAMIWKDRFMLVFGGNARNDIWIFDTESSVWFELPSLNVQNFKKLHPETNIDSMTDEVYDMLEIPLGRRFHSSCLLNDNIYVYGGDCKTHVLEQLSTLFCYSLRTFQWSKIRAQDPYIYNPLPRVYHSLHPVYDKKRGTQCLLVIGGYEGMQSDVSTTISLFELDSWRQEMISNLWYENRYHFCDCYIHFN